MAKTIKFNLICDGKPIRTLEDLRNNFSVEDVLSYFQNGLLKRWLNVRGFSEELKKVSAITSKDEIEIITALVQIFGITTDMADIEKDTFIFKYTQNRQEWLSKYKKAGNDQGRIIKNYHEGYAALIDKILANKDNMPLIKATLQEIEENYYELLDMQFDHVARLFLKNAPMAVFAMLMRPKMRHCGDEAFLMQIGQTEDSSITVAVEDIHNIICKTAIDYDALKKILGNNLREFAGQTDGYWKDIEPKNKRCMILHMEAGNYVRPSGASRKDMGADDINGKFVILDGIDYKSNRKTDKLLYMEV